jgi:hypothetical protein
MPDHYDEFYDEHAVKLRNKVEEGLRIIVEVKDIMKKDRFTQQQILTDLCSYNSEMEHVVRDIMESDLNSSYQ